MGRILDYLLGRAAERPVAERDTAEEVPAIGFPMGGGLVPYNVSATTVMGLDSVARALDVLGVVATLEWTERRGAENLALSRLARRPYPDYSRREWVLAVLRTLALYDVCYLLKVEPYDSEGVPNALWPIPPQIIVPRTLDQYTYTPPTSYVVGRTTVDADRLVVVRRAPTPGLPDYLAGKLRLARATFAAAIAAENYASRYWQAGGSPTTVLTTDANLSEDQMLKHGNRFAQHRALGPDHPVVLSAGYKAGSFGADPTTASAVESNRDMVAKVARLFGIPPRMANAPTENNEVYKTAQEENLDLLHYTLSNYIGAIEDAISDLLPGNRRIVMITAPITEGTQLIRAQANQLATGGVAWLDPDEVRASENLPPREIESPTEDAADAAASDQKPAAAVGAGSSADQISAITGRVAA